jgi:hypothetical protein
MHPPRLCSALFAAVVSIVAGTGLRASGTQSTRTEGGQGGETTQALPSRELGVLLENYRRVHGGSKRLEALERLRFTRTVTTVVGEQEQVGPPQRVEVSLVPGARAVRIEEDRQGLHIVKLHVEGAAEAGRVWVNGEAKSTPELVQQCLADSRELLALLDVLYRIDGPDLAARWDGLRQRSGSQYLCLELSFAPQRGLPFSYRAFFDPQTSLLGRLDFHSAADLARLGTIQLAGYAEFQSLKVPCEWSFTDRAGKRTAAWELTGVEIDTEIAESRFQGL